MISRFLLCIFLGHWMTGGDAKVENNYNGPECYTRLDLFQYIELLQFIEYPSVINGYPHYLWGTKFKDDVLLYCARVTTEKEEGERATETLQIPEHVLNDEVRTVQVIDRKWPDKGGNVVLSAANRPSYFLNFESKKNKEMDYVVTIFGHKKKKNC